jgi:AraC-like DNA-binding protein
MTMSRLANHLPEAAWIDSASGDHATPPATVLGSWIAVLAETVASMGIDATSLLHRAGIDPQQLMLPDARFPVSQAHAAWSLAIEATGDPLIGLAVARRVKPTSFHALGYALMSCASLREMLGCLIRYGKLVSEGGNLSLCMEQAYCAVDVHASTPLEKHAAEVDALMYTIVRACRLCLGPDALPREVWLRRQAPPDRAPFELAFKAPLRFAAPTNRLLFDARLLDRPSLGGHPELARISEGLAASYLARLDRDDICNLVRHTLTEMLPRGEPSQRKVARALAISERGLQRRIAEAGTSFRELLNQTRCEQACMLLQSDQYAISTIAHMLGFSEISSFTRAFKRWKGCSPSDWRTSQH